MRRTLALLSFSFLLGITSCKKDNSPTDGQVVAAHLKSAVGNASVKSIGVSKAGSTTVVSGGSIAIKDDGFIEIYNDTNHLLGTYNLSLLVYYTFESNSLILYF